MLNKNFASCSLNIQKFLGKLIIDLETKKVFFNNTNLLLSESNLTTTEYDLLSQCDLAGIATIPKPQSLWGS